MDDPATLRDPPTLAQDVGTLDRSRYAFPYPPTLDIVPLALLHPIFAEFVSNFELHNPTREDNELVSELRGAMSLEWSSEAMRCHEFRNIVAKHYEIQLHPAGIGGTARITDGRAMVGRAVVVVCEGKEWSGKRYPGVQGCLYWLESIRKTVRDGDPLDLLPCIIISLIGACLLPTLYPCLLFIGPIIGFSGAVITDRVQLEILTEYFTLNTSPHEDAMAIRVARAFGAFRIAFDKLHNHYQDLPESPKPRKRDLRVTFPYPESWATDGDVKLTYHSRLYNNRLIFLAMTTDGATVLVKFTRRYSEAAHRHCAEAGVAPKLLGFRSLAAGWYMAVMEYLGPEAYRVLEPSDVSNNNLVAGTQDVVKILHDGGFVHGDIRHINMVTRREWTSSNDVQNLFLIDFDWAGLEGSVQYPPNINIGSVKRHEGAMDGKLIRKAHDLFMVKHMFDAMGRD